MVRLSGCCLGTPSRGWPFYNRFPPHSVADQNLQTVQGLLEEVAYQYTVGVDHSIGSERITRFWVFLQGWNPRRAEGRLQQLQPSAQPPPMYTLFLTLVGAMVAAAWRAGLQPQGPGGPAGSHGVHGCEGVTWESWPGWLVSRLVGGWAGCC